MFFICNNCQTVFEYVAPKGSDLKWPRECPDCDSTQFRAATKEEVERAKAKGELK